MSDPLDFRDGTLRCDWCGVLYAEEDARRGALLGAERTTHLTICPQCHSSWRRRRQLRHLAYAFMAIAFPVAILMLIALRMSR